MLTQEVVIEKIKKLKNSFITNGFYFDKMILFGSFSYAKQSEESDIDLAIISSLFTGFAFEDRKLISSFFIDDIYSDIDALTIPSSTFEIGNPFIDEIKATGIEV